MIPVIIGVVALSGLAWAKAKSKSATPKKLSPTMQEAFKKLLDAKLSPEKYTQAANLFEDAGLKEEGALLRKRAALAALPPEDKAKLTNAYGAAMSSNKPAGIRAVANVLQNAGAVGAAANLNSHANEVEVANSVSPIPTVVPPPPTPIPVVTAPADAATVAAAPAPPAVITGELVMDDVPLPDEPHPGDAASGPTLSPATGLIAESPPPVFVTMEIPED